MKNKQGLKETFRNKNLSLWLVGILLVALGVLSFVFWSSQKEVWFCDEIYTFESAHGMEQTWPAETKGEWMSGAQMQAFFSADSEQLSLKWISDSLYGDHVPLYFWLFRMVAFYCFKGSATLWTGYSINLFFYILFLCMVYRFFCKLTERPIWAAGIVLTSSIINRVMVAQTTTLRMYMMLVWAELLVVIIGLKIYKEKEQGVLKFTTYLGLLIFSVIGLLIHYDYWIFYGITASIFCGWLLLISVKKQEKAFLKTIEFKCVLAWVGNFIASLLLTIMIFPYCRWNLNKGKGQTALHSIFVFSSEKVEDIVWGFKRLSAVFFGEKLFWVIGIAIILFGIIGAAILMMRRKEYYKVLALSFMTIIAIGYQVVVCFTMPALNEERYLWGGFTLIYMCFVWSVYLLVEGCILRLKLKKRSLIAGGAVVVVTAVLACFQLNIIDNGKGIPYLFNQEKDVAILEEHSNIPWLVYGPTGGVYSYYDWLIPQQICFLSEENTAADAAAVAELKDDNAFIIYCFEEYLPQAVEFMENELDKELSSELLTKSTQLSVFKICEKE